jgi:hypothetical protein
VPEPKWDKQTLVQDWEDKVGVRWQQIQDSGYKWGSIKVNRKMEIKTNFSLQRKELFIWKGRN